MAGTTFGAIKGWMRRRRGGSVLGSPRKFGIGLSIRPTKRNISFRKTQASMFKALRRNTNMTNKAIRFRVLGSGSL